jgi:hypothetical protein
MEIIACQTPLQKDVETQGMKNPERGAQNSQPNYLRNLVTTEFDKARHSYDLFDEFLQQKLYNQNFSLRLLTIARGSARASWDIRRVAVLMLEHQILKLPPDNIADFDLLFTQLNLKSALGVNINLVESVLKDGYSTTELRRFIPEFRRKLERLKRVHHRIKGRRTPEIALRDFIELSRRDCKLSLARYLFQPEEVAARIMAEVKLSEGVRDLDTLQASYVKNEVRRSMSILPDYEANILKKLCETSNIYWVSEETSSEINSLVEYPLTTVVLVVKPPGSDMEFEFKRAGRKGPHPLSVAYTRDGYTVPPSHRLDGASMLWLLRYETRAALTLAIIYRLVHGTEAPVASYLARANISNVPLKNSKSPILRYLTDSRIFGQGFREMRTAMQDSVAAFKDEGYINLPILHQSELGLTARFVGHVTPAQSILAGTTSFRLDKLALYLSIKGPARYFREGLKVEYSKHDARWLADDLLEEILAVYQRPDVRYRNYMQYLRAAFSVAENRVRADHNYLSLMQQIGRFWGTLLAVRGHSKGESFVSRNVGLKSFWDNGQWKVKIIFMDHDALTIPDPEQGNFLAKNSLPCIKLDERYIWGGSNPRQFAISEVGYLQNIYRTGQDINSNGQALAHGALKEAYRRTQDELATNPGLQRFFNKTFVARHRDWDTFVGGYLRAGRDPSARETWKQEMENMVAEKGYRDNAFESYLEAIEENKDFLEKYSFLFDPDRRGNTKKNSGLKAQERV